MAKCKAKLQTCLVIRYNLHEQVLPIGNISARFGIQVCKALRILRRYIEPSTGCVSIAVRFFQDGEMFVHTLEQRKL